MTVSLPRRRLLLLTTLAATTGIAGLSACSPSAEAPIVPAEIDPATTCDLDGMLLADYPGPKAQIFYAGQATPVWCCDTTEMFSLLLKPEQVRAVRAVFVQDMAAADWEQPRGHWFDAKAGHYVLGSKRHGSMGPTLASFRNDADAQRFAGTHGGRVLAFAAVKPEMVDLSGGALHDTRM
jgi:copper chaperone NosL